MDARSDFLQLIERLDTLRREQSLTPDVIHRTLSSVQTASLSTPASEKTTVQASVLHSESQTAETARLAGDSKAGKVDGSGCRPSSR